MRPALSHQMTVTAGNTMISEAVAACLGAAILLFLAITIALLFVLLRRTTSLMRGMVGGDQQDLVAQVEKDFRESNDGLHRRLIEARSGPTRHTGKRYSRGSGQSLRRDSEGHGYSEQLPDQHGRGTQSTLGCI